MGLYENVKEIAKSKGYSINKLEKELGFARSYISKFKTTTPGMDKIQKIADFLGVSSDYIMTGKEDSEQFTQQPQGDDIKVEFDRFRGMLERGEVKPLCYDNTPAGPKEIKALLKMLDASEEMIRNMLNSEE